MGEFHRHAKTNVMIFSVSVHKDGEVCISILHEPGEDKYGYEKASERWLPIHTVETILMSVISMISDPNDESPANVDAAVSKVLKITTLAFGHLPTRVNKCHT